MFRPLLTLSVLAFAAAPAMASTYSAKLTTPTTGRFIARDIVWTCGADACQGATQESRPAVLCESLTKYAGRIDSFIADGRAFTATELDKCNAAAKDGRNKALAAK